MPDRDDPPGHGNIETVGGWQSSVVAYYGPSSKRPFKSDRLILVANPGAGNLRGWKREVKELQATWARRLAFLNPAARPCHEPICARPSSRGPAKGPIARHPDRRALPAREKAIGGAPHCITRQVRPARKGPFVVINGRGPITPGAHGSRAVRYRAGPMASHQPQGPVHWKRRMVGRLFYRWKIGDMPARNPETRSCGCWSIRPSQRSGGDGQDQCRRGGSFPRPAPQSGRRNRGGSIPRGSLSIGFRWWPNPRAAHWSEAPRGHSRIDRTISWIKSRSRPACPNDRSARMRWR